MNGAAQVFARRWWGGELGAAGRVLAGLGMPLSWAWSGAVAVSGALQARRSERVHGVVVVSVGNLAVGGTGKTPVASWIARRLVDADVSTAVVVGGAARDEALLHTSLLPRASVIQDRDRVAATERARATGSDLVILDDGFQHRSLERDLDVVLLAVEDPFPAPVLPCGPYREPARALHRADVVLVTRRVKTAQESRALAQTVDKVAPGRVLGSVALSVTGWRRLGGEESDPPEGDVVAACSVARPLDFRAGLLRRERGGVELVAFPDHHEYTPADVDALVSLTRGRPLVITEKDAVKLRTYESALGETYVLREEVSWDWGEEAFSARLRAAVTHPAGT